MAVAETQYAIGYANDLYAYAGGDFLSANGTMSVQDGELHAQSETGCWWRTSCTKASDR